MTADNIIHALGLPQEAMISRRVPKKLLSDQGAVTAADRKSIQEDIEELVWAAVLKPNNIGVPVYRDETREYLEIAILSLVLRTSAKAGRLIELIHRAVPYPVALTTTQGDKLTLSLAHQRFSQNEAGKTVVDGNIVAVQIAPEKELEEIFLDKMALKHQPAQNLFTLYKGWIECAESLLAARITGHFPKEQKPESADARREALDDRAKLERELVSLKYQAVKEKQINRRVEINLAIQKLEARMKDQLTKL